MIKTIKKLLGIFDAFIDKLFEKLLGRWLPSKEFPRSRFPGENLRKELDKTGDKIQYIFSFIVIIVFMVCAWPFIESITFKMPTMGKFLIFEVIALIIAIVAMLVLGRFFRKKIRTMKTGWLGEVIVGLALSEAGLSNWKIFHSVPKGENGGDIDHVLVCKRGIFCLETKTLFNEPQNITLKGDDVFLGNRPLPEQPINSARKHAVWLKEKIEKEIRIIKFVIPIVIFPFGKIIESSKAGKNYSASEDKEKTFAICTLEGLNELFADLHKEKDTDFSLSEEQIEKIGKMLGELTQSTTPILH